MSTYTQVGITMAGGESHMHSSLSDREIQIVEMVAKGLTNQEIAEELDISKRTVDNHISNILTKTATGNRVALFRWALESGKVCLDNVNCCVLPPFENEDNASNGSLDSSNVQGKSIA